jgi:ubiquinone/menaquinone biosynthesis C-methylase UbiE
MDAVQPDAVGVRWRGGLMTDIVTRLWTDRRHLTTEAYADSANLAARGSIYRYQQPQIELIEWALGHVTWRGTERVLDVGCGPGLYLRRLAQLPGLQLIGMDLSRGMLGDLRRQWGAGPGPSLAVADIQRLPLPDASCDVILAMHMLYHVPDIVVAAHELRRVLCPGGTLLAVTNGTRHLREFSDVYDAAVVAVAGRAPESFNKASHRFRLENGGELLERAFAHVELHDITSELCIPEAQSVVRYIESSRAAHEQVLPAGTSWAAATAEVERIVTERIAEQGAFRAQTHAGVFLCR